MEDQGGRLYRKREERASKGQNNEEMNIFV